MKKLLVTLLCVLQILMLCACGTEYTCLVCGKKTKKAYYDVGGTKVAVMCEDCAEEYWAPLDYENFRVKN